ncbi:SIMPL domain-containing protein [Chryseobacterium sp. RR2-3-20]|uniref:SIMPL domain-containing protein n=1 Tax=Chryseobacterium sp. RR2-3-20 TaxID=2787626 RepID=UPI001AE09FEF|nr:SIMPL domain-containing protein [Chryseobacterium sp. RR2-3-20]
MKNHFYNIKTQILIVLVLFVSTILIKSQISGNQVYKNQNSYQNNRVQISDSKNIYTTDSTMVINVNVLLNKKADFLKITLGLSEEAESPKKAIEKINVRIQNFIRKLSLLGIKKENFFVDFIAQTKVYDVSLSDDKKLISEKIKGFEIKKNIIITISNHSEIEKIISYASDYQIYDIIKVDYMNDDLEKIHQELLYEANKIANRKKEEYLKSYKKEIIGNPTMNYSLNYIFPASQYQQYSAYESSDFDLMRGYYNNDLMIKKMERKSKTFYYEGIPYNGFDKIINNQDPEIGIQYIMNISVKYDFKKNR